MKAVTIMICKQVSLSTDTIPFEEYAICGLLGWVNISPMAGIIRHVNHQGIYEDDCENR